MKIKADRIHGKISIDVLTDEERVLRVTPEAEQFVRAEVAKIAPQIERYYSLKAEGGAGNEQAGEQMYNLRYEIIETVCDIESAATEIQRQ